MTYLRPGLIFQTQMNAQHKFQIKFFSVSITRRCCDLPMRKRCGAPPGGCSGTPGSGITCWTGRCGFTDNFCRQTTRLSHISDTSSMRCNTYMPNEDTDRGQKHEAINFGFFNCLWSWVDYFRLHYTLHWRMKWKSDEIIIQFCHFISHESNLWFFLIENVIYAITRRHTTQLSYTQLLYAVRKWKKRKERCDLIAGNASGNSSETENHFGVWRSEAEPTILFGFGEGEAVECGWIFPFHFDDPFVFA